MRSRTAACARRFILILAACAALPALSAVAQPPVCCESSQVARFFQESRLLAETLALEDYIVSPQALEAFGAAARAVRPMSKALSHDSRHRLVAAFDAAIDGILLHDETVEHALDEEGLQVVRPPAAFHLAAGVTVNGGGGADCVGGGPGCHAPSLPNCLSYCSSISDTGRRTAA